MPKIEKGELTHVVLAKGDQQVPFHDTRAIRVVRRIIADLQPDTIIDVGDWLDLPDLSTKFAARPDHKHQLKAACEIVREQFEKESEAAPEAERFWLEGNHEKRLRVFIEVHAEPLADLTKNGGVLTIPSLVGITDKVKYVGPYGSVIKHKYGRGSQFIFKHGDATTKYAAARELEIAHENGASGHTHRMSNAMNTTYDGPHGWWSIGCLCNIKGDNCPPGYTDTDQYRNWQQGILVITFSNERALFQVEPVLIHEGAAIFRGREYIDNGSKDEKRKTFS